MENWVLFHSSNPLNLNLWIVTIVRRQEEKQNESQMTWEVTIQAKSVILPNYIPEGVCLIG